MIFSAFLIYRRRGDFRFFKKCDTFRLKINSVPAHSGLTRHNKKKMSTTRYSAITRLFMTVDALLVSLSFVLAAIFLFEGPPGPLTTQIGIFGTDISYLLFGPVPCDSFVCYSDLNSLPKAKSRTSIKEKIEFLGDFDTITTCEQACVKYKVCPTSITQNIPPPRPRPSLSHFGHAARFYAKKETSPEAHVSPEPRETQKQKRNSRS